MKRDHYDNFYSSKPFQDIFNLSKQSLVLKADPPSYTVLAVSDHCLGITQNVRERVLNRPLFEAYPGNQEEGGMDQKLVSDSFQRVIDTGEKDILPVFKYEIFVAQENRYETLYWSNINEPVFDDSGKVSYVINTTENVTDRMLIAQALQKNVELELQIATQTAALDDREQLFQRLIEQAPVAIALMRGPEFVLEICNEKVLEIWGRTAGQIIGLPVFSALPETRGQGFEELLNRVRESGMREVIREMPSEIFRNQQMETIWVNFIYEPIRDRNGDIDSVIVVCTEITEQVNGRLKLEQLLREKTELIEKIEELSRQKLAESEQILATAVNSANLGTWYVDLKTGAFLPSVRLKELFGLEPDDPITIPSAIGQVAESHRTLVTEAIQRSIVQNLPFDMEYPVTGVRDHVTRWVRCTGRTYPADQHKHPYFSGTMLDITSRKEAERRKDDFISIASHELKTPITSLKAALQFMNRMKDESVSPMLSKMIDLASGSMDRISGLIDDLLNAAQMEHQVMELKKTKFSFGSLTENLRKHFKSFEQYHINISGDLKQEITADQDRIEHVLISFLNNAVKYAGDSQEISLRLEELPEAGEIRISVSDSGPGISQEKIKDLFERYYRTDHSQTQYAGMGLGLYLSAQIVERHDGKIGVHSKLGEGSTFWFSLPR